MVSNFPSRLTYWFKHQVLRLLFERQEKSPSEVVTENEWGMITDEDAILKVVNEIIQEYPDAVSTLLVHSS